MLKSSGVAAQVSTVVQGVAQGTTRPTWVDSSEKHKWLGGPLVPDSASGDDTTTIEKVSE